MNLKIPNFGIIINNPIKVTMVTLVQNIFMTTEELWVYPSVILSKIMVSIYVLSSVFFLTCILSSFCTLYIFEFLALSQRHVVSWLVTKTVLRCSQCPWAMAGWKKICQLCWLNTNFLALPKGQNKPKTKIF